MKYVSKWLVDVALRHGSSTLQRDMAANAAGGFSIRRMVRNWRRNELLFSLNEYGLKKDDLIVSEDPVVKEALSRLDPEELRQRQKRIIRAHESYLTKSPVPEDCRDPDPLKPYLLPIIMEVRKEKAEMESLNNY